MLLRHFVYACYMLLAAAATAAPVDYQLDPGQSAVRFTWFYGGSPVSGEIDIANAQVRLDLEQIGRSDVRVALDAGSAQAGFVFATQALRGPHMFDADSFPVITFASEAVRVQNGQVEVTGAVTIRGVTQPMAMRAMLYRQNGTAPQDRDHLAIELVGTIDRHAFGASGWPDEIGAQVDIRILAYIDRVQ